MYHFTGSSVRQCDQCRATLEEGNAAFASAKAHLDLILFTFFTKVNAEGSLCP